MLKKTIRFEDVNGELITEDFFFNLTKAELVELEVSEKGGLVDVLQQIIRTEDKAKIIALFKKIILMSYGEKSEDGRRFIKTQELRDNFSQTEAYSELFMEFATDANAAAEFMNGVIPASLAAEVAKETAEIAKPQDHKRADAVVLKQGGKK